MMLMTLSVAKVTTQTKSTPKKAPTLLSSTWFSTSRRRRDVGVFFVGVVESSAAAAAGGGASLSGDTPRFRLAALPGSRWRSGRPSSRSSPVLHVPQKINVDDVPSATEHSVCFSPSLAVDSRTLPICSAGLAAIRLEGRLPFFKLTALRLP